MSSSTSKSGGPGDDWRSSLRDASPYVGLGMQLALSMVFFAGGGYLLDRWFGTTPWLLVAGAVLGMVAVFAQLIRVSTELSAKDRAKRKDEGGDRPSGRS